MGPHHYWGKAAISSQFKQQGPNLLEGTIHQRLTIQDGVGRVPSTQRIQAAAERSIRRNWEIRREQQELPESSSNPIRLGFKARAPFFRK
jgi:hypothetical protein